MMNSKALDIGYAHALGLGGTILATTGLIAWRLGPDFQLLWMAPWAPLSILAVGLYFTIQTIHYAVRTGFHWPLNYVALLAAVYAPFALENWGIPVTAGLMIIKYRPGIILSLGYGSLCVCVSAYWFVFGRFTAPKATRRWRDSLLLFGALVLTTVLVWLVVRPSLPPWVSHKVLVLQEAARHGDLNAVKLAIESGVNPRAKDRVGWDSLMWAVSKERTEVVAYLLDHGADPNAREYSRPTDGDTLIWRDPDDPSRGGFASGSTVMDIAIARANPEIVRMLIEKGANLRDIDVCRVWTHQVLKVLLEKGGVTGATAGRTSVYATAGLNCALSRFACSGELESVKLLLDHGAGPDQLDPNIQEPQKCPAGIGYEEIRELSTRREVGR
ncbi:MAG: ankyrin repeat domain-containing protein [Sulfuricella sp.]|nr:ankyrin repeat domain-containing protein [Sulfuricella sp.]